MYLCTYISNNPKNENSAAAASNFLNANIEMHHSRILLPFKLQLLCVVVSLMLLMLSMFNRTHPWKAHYLHCFPGSLGSKKQISRPAIQPPFLPMP